MWSHIGHAHFCVMGYSPLHLMSRGSKKGKGGFEEAAVEGEKPHRKVYILNFILSNDGDATART